MAHGFDAAAAALEAKSPETPGAVLLAVGGTLISKAAGASGPLYGTAFRRAGKTLGSDVGQVPGQVGAGRQHRHEAPR